MDPLFDKSFGLLARGDWSELVGVIILFGIYAVGALAKLFSNRSSESKEDVSSKQRAIELAKKYAKERQSQPQMRQAAPKRPQGALTEWDRMQELKRQKLAQLREQMNPQAKSANMPDFQRKETPKPRPIPASPPPEFIADVEPRKTQIFHRYMEAAQQQEQAIQPPQVTAKPQRAKPARYTRKPAVAEVAKTVRTLDHLLKNPSDLRAAIILKEILDKPIGLREDW